MTREQLVEMLLKMKGDGKQTELALRLGISPQYLNDVLAGTRHPGKLLLAVLGLKKVIEYRAIDKN